MQMRQMLVGAAVLAAVSFVFSGQLGFFSGFDKYLVTNFPVRGPSSFTYYKLSLTWPPSACSVPPPAKQCVKIPTEMFTIHGLWPQLDGDVAVSPYKIDHTCTNIIPTPETNLAASLVTIPPLELTTNWPDLFSTVDLDFWKYEWGRHGMCSDYPDDPSTYFNSTLNLHQNFINLPIVLGITLGIRSKASDILDFVKAKFNVYPQILCNNKVGNNAQLLEIRFCYKRTKPPVALDDCPCRLSVCEYHTQIVLPRA